MIKITTEIEEKTIQKLAKDIMENFPEYGVCLQCTSWKYEEGKFNFLDEEDNSTTYRITTNMVAKALPKFMQLILNKKLFFYGVKTLEDILDPCNWDMPISDALIQFTIFGEVIYG